MSGLLIDEMFTPLVAEALRGRGHNVISIHEHPGAIGLPDRQVLELAITLQRCLLTENVADFEVLRVQRLTDGQLCAGLLYTSQNRFPRTKSAMGRLIDALDGACSEERLPNPGQVAWLR
jgi:hypothetical protein